ncbi:MAG: hypothetical protein ABI488_18545 [Polyangiaceae bacterium]
MASAARLDIRSAQDIIAALESPDLGTRLALCQAAAAHPAHILAYGAAAGIDLVASFLNAAKKRSSLVMRKATLAALVNFDDPRVVALFRDVLQTSSESDVLRLAAKRVALDASAGSRQFLRERLLAETLPLRVRCIASALSATEELTQAEKLRLRLAGVGSASGVEHLPERDAACAASWARELAGPFALSARRLLERSGGPAALLALLPHWTAWAVADRAWFLGWGLALFGSEQPPAAVCSLLTWALAQPAKAVNAAALRWCSRASGAVSGSAIERFTTSEDAELRFSALLALPSQDRDWWHIARTDTEPSVRALGIERALERAEAEPSDELARFIADSDWRVRAAVVRALSQNGAVAIERARGWLAHQDAQVRAGALRLLLDQGQERWLADNLMG